MAKLPYSRLQLRRGSKQWWIDTNPVLLDGEMGVELDTLKVKVGNGKDDWNSLPYIGRDVIIGSDEINPDDILDPGVVVYDQTNYFIKIGDGTTPFKDLPYIDLVGKFDRDDDGNIRGEIFNDYENNSATGLYSHSEGRNSVASGAASHAEGYGSKANKNYSHAEGQNSVASGAASHAEGYGSKANKNYSHAEGRNSVASGAASHAEGFGTITGENATGSHAEGGDTQATGAYSHAEGLLSVASGNASHAEGGLADGENSKNSVASGNASHAEGISEASGDFSHAGGYESVAEGEASFAHGKSVIIDEVLTKTIASGIGSSAFGIGSQATAKGAHSEGSMTEASGESAHAEGYETKATGLHSHAEGSMTEASGESAHAEGRGTIAHGEAQHVQGKYNIGDTENKYAFIIGNGTDNDNRSNLFTISNDGTIESKITIDGETKDTKIISEYDLSKYADAVIGVKGLHNFTECDYLYCNSGDEEKEYSAGDIICKNGDKITASKVKSKVDGNNYPYASSITTLIFQLMRIIKIGSYDYYDANLKLIFLGGSYSIYHPILIEYPNIEICGIGEVNFESKIKDICGGKIINPMNLNYKGNLDENNTLPTDNVEIGDVYIVDKDGIYDEKVAMCGNMFIASSSRPSWEFINSLKGSYDILIRLNNDPYNWNKLCDGKRRIFLTQEEFNAFGEVVPADYSDSDVIIVDETQVYTIIIEGESKKFKLLEVDYANNNNIESPYGIFDIKISFYCKKNDWKIVLNNINILGSRTSDPDTNSTNENCVRIINTEDRSSDIKNSIFNIVIKNCTIGNARGSGILTDYHVANVTIDNCVIRNNRRCGILTSWWGRNEILNDPETIRGCHNFRIMNNAFIGNNRDEVKIGTNSSDCTPNVDIGNLSSYLDRADIVLGGNDSNIAILNNTSLYKKDYARNIFNTVLLKNGDTTAGPQKLDDDEITISEISSASELNLTSKGFIRIHPNVGLSPQYNETNQLKTNSYSNNKDKAVIDDASLAYFQIVWASNINTHINGWPNVPAWPAWC